MAVTASPASRIVFNDTLTVAGTKTLTITRPAGVSYKFKSITVTGTNAATTVSVTSNGAAIITDAAIGVATKTVALTATSPNLVTNIVITAGVGGTITGGFIDCSASSSITLASVLAA